jgi:hypothetical protein
MVEAQKLKPILRRYCADDDKIRVKDFWGKIL